MSGSDCTERGNPSGSADQRLHGRQRWWRNVLVALAVAVTSLGPAIAFALQDHTVQPGETLSGIAAQYGVPVDQLAAENGITDPNLIFVGQQITIGSAVAAAAPAPLAAASYTVTDGDTLSAIAAQYGVTVDVLVQANNLTDPNTVFAGELLAIPQQSAPAPGSLHPEVEPILRAAEVEFGLPRGLLRALAWQESGWQQGIVSSAGAVGVTQILPDTATWAIAVLGMDAHNWQNSVRDNARLGAAVLAFYLHRTGGNELMALAAYYQGWRSVQTSGVFHETKLYADNIIAMSSLFH